MQTDTQHSVPMPVDEVHRLQRVQRLLALEGLDQDLELKRLTALAAQLVGAPFAQITLLDAERHHVLAPHGMPGWTAPRCETVCTHTILDLKRPLVVSDLQQDARFADLPPPAEGLSLRFYAGVPLDGGALSGLGALCVLDSQPRSLQPWQLTALRTLAEAVATRLLLLQAQRSLQSIGAPAAAPPHRRLSRRHELQAALEAGEFINVYQPKFELRTRKLVGAEALMRWQHPQQGLIPPARFVAEMEQLGLIHEAGKRVAQGAVQHWAGWARRGLMPPTIAVNVSPTELLSDRLIADLIAAVESAGSLRHLKAPLAIEITESSFVEDQGRALEVIRAVHGRGIKVALDDFGTGFSSLSYLAQLPVDTLKVDSSFVARMTEDPRAMGLVSTVIDLAHGLDMDVVAEGIETEEQVKLLRLLRCDVGQGYLLGKPMGAEAFVALLETQRTF